MSNIFIISAPSGCGKTSLVRELCQTYSFLEQTVSYTTRTIRSGEVDGQDYHFISKDEFIENKKNNKFIESQNVYDNFYGTTYESINEILASGKDAILEIDYKGMLLIKSKIPSSTLSPFNVVSKALYVFANAWTSKLEIHIESSANTSKERSPVIL